MRRMKEMTKVEERKLLEVKSILFYTEVSVHLVV